MKTESSFHMMRGHALTEGGRVFYMCGSERSRAESWKHWKDWSGPMGDGPLHDNKAFITRFNNGGTVEFRIAAMALI